MTHADDRLEADATDEGMPPAPDHIRDTKAGTINKQSTLFGKSDGNHGTAHGGSHRSETDTDVKESLHRAIHPDTTIAEAISVVRRRARTWVEDAIRQKPALAVGGAFALGLLAVTLAMRD